MIQGQGRGQHRVTLNKQVTGGSWGSWAPQETVWTICQSPQ